MPTHGGYHPACQAYKQKPECRRFRSCPPDQKLSSRQLEFECVCSSVSTCLILSFHSDEFQVPRI